MPDTRYSIHPNNSGLRLVNRFEPFTKPRATSLKPLLASSIGCDGERLALDDVAAGDDALFAVFPDFQEPLFGELQ